MCRNVFSFVFLLLGIAMAGESQELALYTQPSFLKVFSQDTRQFEVNGMIWEVKQDWNQLGVAGVIWESAVILSQYLVNHNHLVKGKRVIELGAGTGLVGMVTATLGAESVTITDREMRMIEENLLLNRENLDQSCITPLLYDWGTPLSSLFHSSFDIVLGSDIIYIEGTYPLLVETLNMLSATPNVLILLSAQERHNKVKLFMEKLLENGKFTSTVVHTEGAVQVFCIMQKMS